MDELYSQMFRFNPTTLTFGLTPFEQDELSVLAFQDLTLTVAEHGALQQARWGRLDLASDSAKTAWTTMAGFYREERNIAELREAFPAVGGDAKALDDKGNVDFLYAADLALSGLRQMPAGNAANRMSTSYSVDGYISGSGHFPLTPTNPALIETPRVQAATVESGSW